jgi:type VI secretion system protein ImpI
MLREFDPENLQERFDRQNKKGTLLGGRTKYWERYRDFYHDFAADPERTFRDLFGAEFAHAYEAEMQRLKGLAHAKGPTV